ncbi:MAG: lipoyl synthase [Magnetococcales bacterium]|nr:lipoyl synthase [Magnetococcales bacterium]MBF0156384.1 lipoyl synthase [Magnetococcales bacterium]
MPGKPRWLKVKAPTSTRVLALKSLLGQFGLATVCEAASCPNRGGCWDEGAAAFMILGSVCTRRCAFCNVTPGRPEAVDPTEPERLRQAAAALGLRHVVITSVTRDDLADGGAGHFAACVRALRQPLEGRNPVPTLELLTPDFRGKPGALEAVIATAPEIFNHNIETVPRLYPVVRPAADYTGSLALLRRAGELATAGSRTKSGLMLGLGESREEVESVLRDLRQAGVRLLTIGQYLRPGERNHPVIRYWLPEEFAELGQRAREMGFEGVESHPLARSSFHAHQHAQAHLHAQAPPPSIPILHH